MGSEAGDGRVGGMVTIRRVSRRVDNLGLDLNGIGGGGGKCDSMFSCRIPSI